MIPANDDDLRIITYYFVLNSGLKRVLAAIYSLLLDMENGDGLSTGTLPYYLTGTFDTKTLFPFRSRAHRVKTDPRLWDGGRSGGRDAPLVAASPKWKADLCRPFRPWGIPSSGRG